MLPLLDVVPPELRRCILKACVRRHTHDRTPTWETLLKAMLLTCKPLAAQMRTLLLERARNLWLPPGVYGLTMQCTRKTLLLDELPADVPPGCWFHVEVSLAIDWFGNVRGEGTDQEFTPTAEALAEAVGGVSTGKDEGGLQIKQDNDIQ